MLAAFSFRIGVDLCLQNPRTLPLARKAVHSARKAVHSFMRVVISFNQETGVLDTTEPVLARAAMESLCHKQNWATSIRTFTDEFIQQTLIEKGLQGELFSRLILILDARFVSIGQTSQYPCSYPKRINGNIHGT